MSTFLLDTIADIKTDAHADVSTKTVAFSLSPADHGAILERLCDAFAALGWDIDSATPTTLFNLLDIMIGNIVSSNTFTDETGVYLRNATSIIGGLYNDGSGNTLWRLRDGTTDKWLKYNPAGVLSANRTLTAIDATGKNPVVVSNTRLAAQIAVGTIATFTTPNPTPTANHTYRIGGYALVSAISTDVISFEVAFTDEAGTPQVIRLAGILAINAPSSAINAVGFWAMNSIEIAALANTTITVRTTLSTSGGSFTSDFRAVITQLD